MENGKKDGLSFRLYLTKYTLETPMENYIKLSVFNSEEATAEEKLENRINWSMDRGYVIVKILNWHEFPIEIYPKLPPDNIIEKFNQIKSKEIFDNYIVAELSQKIEIKPMPMADPLLIGLINGSTDRYILGQWDDDIYIDDLA